ncbi:anti-sigma B factor antagonist [Streptacidiphilus sp. MAP12-16]|uniref:STAS domain-containing protein n=1 Tax=Streptacidiphilus sp. MAP12-16 TaxID=3156300 RepID=UPI0035162571
MRDDGWGVVMEAGEWTFGLQERAAGRVLVVELHGELDLMALQELTWRLDMLSSGPRPDLLVDLRPVTFIDASGMRLLLRLRARVARTGGRLRVVRGTPWVSEVLRIAQVEQAFTMLDALPPELEPGRAGGGLEAGGSIPA